MGLAKTFLAIGISVIFVVFIAYALYVIYEPPNYYSYGSNDCYSTHNCQQQVTACQKQYNNNYSDSRYKDCYSNVTQSTQYKTCQELLLKCTEESSKKLLVISIQEIVSILLVIGIIAIIAGICLTGLESIGSGLMGGGILVVLWSLIYTWQYWSSLNKYIKLIALGIVLVILIYLGYKKLEKKK